MEFGSFDIIVGMDWLSLNRVEVICFEKMLRIPLTNDHMLELSWLTWWKERDKIKIQDVPVVKEYPDVFPDNLPGFPPARPVEFRIDLVPRATPVAKPPYRLAPSEMQELSSQLHEFLDKGFIRPS
ncbi:hypothetical protein E3N88_22410 [Mikania micrantha]|uniref:Reverse transcriptase domain-containing protein n=1 Tax=Mikania micrantha TaxID=192012 RepID=A0A5N6NBG7_9ASTR|nr:hypothetical protein E3N88_22410 [Mikania micrantha]